MAKYVLLILVILCAIQVMRATRKMRNNSGDGKPSRENMIACDYCHVNFPQSEKVVAKGRVFCSEDHQRAYNG